ncbi:MAG: histidinol-phosphatase [Lachnospiraceae bacterium]|nr:histidinol-phosphatase [Lachnospiraceae bacterium]
MKANYHTHTPRCHHAVGSEREYIERAIEEGFEILGFSDHTPWPFKSNIRMSMDQVGEYTDTLVKLREEYKDRIKIYIGYEVEYFPKYFDELIKELKKYPLDYIIQGQHFVPDELTGFYTGAVTRDITKLKAYADLVVEGMKTGLFSYVAHPDLMNFVGDEEIYRHHMAKIIETAVDMDIPLEVNMYGFDDGRHYPSDRFFSFAKEFNPRFVLGCDAHKPMMIRQPEHAEGLVDFLRENGIEYGDNTIKLRRV